VPGLELLMCSASSQYHCCSFIDDDGEHDDADNDKNGDVSSPRQIDHRGLRKFNEREEFNDNEYEKDLDRVDVEYGQQSNGDKRER